MQINKKITFLYAEITPYFYGCLKYLANKYPLYKVEVIYIDKFENINLNEISGYNFSNKDKFSSKHELFKHLDFNQPDLLLVSGRMDKDYLYVTKKLSKKCITVSLQDTIYSNSIKQFIKKLFSRYLYKQYFKKIWATGTMHSAFALSMGYSYDKIRDGFYVADEKYFNEEIHKTYEDESYKFLFIGRLVKEKNIEVFASMLDQINSQSKTNHELNIIGRGILENKIKKYKCVRLLGFKNIDEMIHISKKCHVFCLPSKYEPWGVVLHEMALLSMPILASENCGSSFDLVQNNINGFKFNPEDKKSIRKSILKFINLTNKQKIEFGIASKLLAKKYNHDYWCNSLISLFD